MPLLKPPGGVLDLARRLEEAGYEAWCVGGAVRDALLGIPHLDWDLATSATPEQVREAFGRRRTIPVGIEFGTVGVLDSRGVMHEVTTFRRDVRTDGRHAVVEFGASLEEDLARRDFTINAIAYSPRHDELRDPFGGREDLERRLIRAVGDADARMREDRLRALRAIRFAARFDFDIEPETLAAIERSAPHLGRLSAERVKQELEKTMDQVRSPSRAFALWRSTGALRVLIPALERVDDETLRALDCLAMPGPRGRPQRRLNRLTMLFLDLAPAERDAALAALKFSKDESKWIAALADVWRAIGDDVARAVQSERLAPGGERAIRQWVARIQRLRVGAFMRLAIARWSAEGRLQSTDERRRAIRLYRAMQRSAFRDPLEIADLAVDGEDLRRIGIPAGPVLGRILRHLLERVLDDPTRNTTDWLLQEARRCHEQQPPESAR